jgi:predicted N-acyltransferase
MAQQGLTIRHDCQFHWRNAGYGTFEDFLAALTAKKRKNIRQERRKVADAGITFRQLDGHTASGADWERFAFFYQHTFENKWGMPTMNVGFFCEMARALGEQVLLIMADNREGECIAGSLMFRSATRLYGRHWGCTQEIDSLHFEACYYQGIEYCIRHGLQVFEPGAQGEHKIPRGFIPTLTRSGHWLREAVFRQAIARHAEYEKGTVKDYMQSASRHLPYR